MFVWFPRDGRSIPDDILNGYNHHKHLLAILLSNISLPAMKGYRPSILKFLPNLQCPLYLILTQIEDIPTISFSHCFPDLNVHIDAPKGNADEYWRLFLRYCFDLIARLKENSLRSSVIIRCRYPYQDKYRGLYYFRYDTGTIDFDCSDSIYVDSLTMNHPQITDSDLPMQGGPVGSSQLPKDLGFSAVAPYINKMGPWMLEVCADVAIRPLCISQYY